MSKMSYLNYEWYCYGLDCGLMIQGLVIPVVMTHRAD